MTTTPPPSAAAVELAKRINSQEVFDYDGTPDGTFSEYSCARLIDQHTADLRAQLADTKKAWDECAKSELELFEDNQQLLAHAKAMREALEICNNSMQGHNKEIEGCDYRFAGSLLTSRANIAAFDDFMRGK